MVQTTQRLEERLGRAGSPYDAQPFDSVSRIAEVALRPADLAIRGTDSDSDGKGARKLEAPAAADVDAIIATIASAAAPQTISGAGLDGVIGGGDMIPARNVTLTFDAHADWDPSNATVEGEDINGDVVTELLAIATSTTATGAVLFRKITSLTIPTQTGAGGTATMGTGTLLGGLTGADVVGMIRYLAARETAENATAEFAQFDVLSVITGGRVWVETEVAVSDGERVFVRLVTAAAEEINAYRNDRDGTAAAPDAVPLIGARYHGDSVLRDGVRLAVVQFDMTAN